MSSELERAQHPPLGSRFQGVDPGVVRVVHYINRSTSNPPNLGAGFFKFAFSPQEEVVQVPHGVLGSAVVMKRGLLHVASGGHDTSCLTGKYPCSVLWGVQQCQLDPDIEHPFRYPAICVNIKIYLYRWSECTPQCS